MYLDCERAMRIAIPAMRVSVSNRLNKEHNMSESEIAKRLGIAQPAVSKYLNRRYSKRIARLEKLISSKGLEKPVVKAILSNAGPKMVNDSIDSISENTMLMEDALKIIDQKD